MTDAVRKPLPAAPAANRQAPAAGPAAKPPAKPAASAIAQDYTDFLVLGMKPSAAMIHEWEATVNALDALPKKPSGGRNEVPVWFAAVSPKLEAARQAIKDLEEEARDFSPSRVPKVKELRAKVDALASKVEDAQIAMGMLWPKKPAQDWAAGIMAQSNPLIAALGALAFIPAIIVDKVRNALPRPH